MSDYGEPMFYQDIDSDLSLVKARLLDSLLTLPKTCFMRRAPAIVSEKVFETGEMLHKATYRYIPFRPLTQDVEMIGFGLKEEEEDE